MFDKTIVHQAPAYPQTIHEHRAPTDDSVRLLREMEDAAQKKIERSMVLPSNDIRAVVHSMHLPMSCATQIAVLYTVNGLKERVDVVLSDLHRTSVDERIDQIIDALAKDIAVKLLKQAITPSFLREVMG